MCEKGIQTRVEPKTVIQKGTKLDKNQTCLGYDVTDEINYYESVADKFINLARSPLVDRPIPLEVIKLRESGFGSTKVIEIKIDPYTGRRVAE